MEKLLNTIFPPRCAVCGKAHGYICGSCLGEFSPIEKMYCIVCDGPSVMGETHVKCKKEGYPEAIYSSYHYENEVRKCIKMSKYSLRQFSVLKALTYEACRQLSKSDFVQGNYLAVPIPLSPKKIKLRGFNQAEIIARIVCTALKIKTGQHLLKRTKDTESQFKNSREARFDNLENAFEASNLVEGKKILLIDDICTSGATFIRASEVLYAKGAQSIRCYSLSKKFKSRKEI